MSGASATLIISYAPLGAARALFACRDREVLIDGPANTGKTYACLWKLHLVLLKYPGARGLLVRKTHSSLKASALVTYQQKILHPAEAVKFHGGNAKQPPMFLYPNGSVLVIGGLDKPEKIMSSEYDICYVNEATDLDLADWEAILTRLRHGVMPYHQLLADANPQGPTHWLKLRCDADRTTRLPSRHEDNPTVTEDYLDMLRSLTGVRRARLYSGEWQAAEGAVYEDVWDSARNVVPSFPIPADWPRFLGIDFGFTNPFVAQWWAEDPDGRLYLYREVYRTKTLVEDHAATIRRISRWGQPSGDPIPRAIICDHDAEDRATLERHLGLFTLAAHKSVSDGLQAVALRMRPAGDGRPRLFLFRDAVYEHDADLRDHKKPTCTIEEVDGYVWDMAGGAKRGEQPVKRDDHGMDTMRYIVAHRDVVPSAVWQGPHLMPGGNW